MERKGEPTKPFFAHVNGVELKGWYKISESQVNAENLSSKPGNEVRGFNQNRLGGLMLKVENYQGTLSKDPISVNKLLGSKLTLIIDEHNLTGLTVTLFDPSVEASEPITEDLMIAYDCTKKASKGSFTIVSKEDVMQWREGMSEGLRLSLLESSEVAEEKRNYFEGLPNFHNNLILKNKLNILEARERTLAKTEIEIQKDMAKLKISLKEVQTGKIETRELHETTEDQVTDPGFQRILNINKNAG